MRSDAFNDSQSCSSRREAAGQPPGTVLSLFWLSDKGLVFYPYCPNKKAHPILGQALSGLFLFCFQQFFQFRTQLEIARKAGFCTFVQQAIDAVDDGSFQFGILYRFAIDVEVQFPFINQIIPIPIK